MGKRCICEICTCGRHRCPHRPYAPLAGADKPCMLSEYATTYHPHAIKLREAFKPPARAVDSDAPLESKTTNRVDYVKHPVERPHQHIPDAYKRPAGEHDMLTSYTKDYPEKWVDPAKAVKHDTGRQAQTKFEGEPTYTSDYRKWAMEKPKKYGPEAVWQPPKDPFGGESTFQGDYKRYNAKPRALIRPPNAGVSSDSPFDGTTGYSVDYVKHPLEPRAMKEKERYKPAGVPMDGLTTFKKDYRGEQGDRMGSFKPEGRAVASDAPFVDQTTFNTDYRPWPTERPFQHQPDQYRKPDGDMDMNTTNRITYKKHPLQKHQAVKPPQGRVMDPGQFEGNTSYATDFRQWDASRAQPVLRPDYHPNTAPFEGISTQKAHYIPHPWQNTGSFKPGHTAVATGPFQGDTMYNTEFTPKQVLPCPAAILETTASSYTYVNQDNRGHKFYQPIRTTITPLAAQGKNRPGGATGAGLQPLAVA